MALIREETAADHYAIRKVNELAFHGDQEARLVDALRNDGAVILSLLAIENDEIVGHILFSHLTIDADTGVLHAVSLAPMAVLPEYQRRGIGSALVRRGLEICRERGYSIVVVLGHPEYYPRFGFSAELAKNLHSPYSRVRAAWMAVELAPSALRGVKGEVRYPRAFDAVS